MPTYPLIEYSYIYSETSDCLWQYYRDEPALNSYLWNPSICDCECNKACKIDECSDIKACSCEKR